MLSRDQHIAGQAEFVCTHLGVGVPRLVTVQVVHCILMGAGGVDVLLMGFSYAPMPTESS